jgi:predicted MFS family arabinose efflux permease
MNAANLPGRFLPNLISDACIGPLNTVIPATFLAATQLFAWIGATNHTSLILVACFYGFWAAGLQSLYNTTIVEFTDPSNRRARMALVYVVIGAACLTGAPMGGALIGRDGGGYLYAQIFAGGSVLVGAAFLLAARVAKKGWASERV